jgi:hypothetical protein
MIHITKNESRRVKLKDVPVGCIFSLDSGTTGMKVTSYKDLEPVERIVLFKEYIVQGFYPEEEVTLWYGAELQLR